MSKIGKKPITIPDNVTLIVNLPTVTAKGAVSEKSLTLPASVTAEVVGSELVIKPKNQGKMSAADWGLARALANNLINGVKEPFRKDLELNGIGYRAEKRGENLVLSLGFSHPIEVSAPSGICFEVNDKNKIAVIGADKQQVGYLAAKIRSLKPPEPYKGKGLRYAGEVIRKKAGKAGKAGGGVGAK